MDVSLPPPFGHPTGPSCALGELITRYLEGARDGYCSQARLEGCVLYATEYGADEPVALRLDGALLVRDELAEEIAGVRAALYDALGQAGLALVDEDTPLAGIVEIEIVGRRGDAWSLWASDPDVGHKVLAERAAGDMPGLLEQQRARQAAEEETAATLRRLEQEL